MGSAILDIYSYISSDIKPTPSSDVTVRIQSIGNVNEFAHTDDLPMRKLQAFSNESEGEFAFIALGNTSQVTWTVVDRFFYRHANQGEGWEAFADDLTKYAKSYMDILQTHRAPTCQSHIVSARFVPYVFDFPTGSTTKRIAGVDVILTIEELF